MKYETTAKGRVLIQSFGEARRHDKKAGHYTDPISRMIGRANNDGLDAIQWVTDTPRHRYVVVVVPFGDEESAIRVRGER